MSGMTEGKNETDAQWLDGRMDGWSERNDTAVHDMTE